jgi:hypothetical protein
VPVHVIRFEDLLHDQQNQINGVFEFVLGIESVNGLYIGKRIDDVLKKGQAGVLYKPRAGQMNSNMKYYN